MTTAKFDISTIWHYHLRQGASSDPSSGACLFDAGMWLVYGRIGDNPPCSCPVIRAYGIGLNDRMPDAVRQQLKPFILRIVGNRDPAAEEARRKFIVLETARRVVPLVLDEKWPNLAAEDIGLSDKATMLEIRRVMRKLYDAATAAAAAAAATTAATAAAAAAAATTNATAATYAATASAYAAAAAAAAACTAAAATTAATIATAATNTASAYAAAAAAATAAWDEAIWILDNVLKIGKQAPEFDEEEVRRSVREFDLARAR